jgi:hypothetical protein
MPSDWIYKITSIDMYEKVDLKLFEEMLVNWVLFVTITLTNINNYGGQNVSAKW